MTVQVIHGDALTLPFPDESIDAIVCDPPYGLEFMGKEWDKFKTDRRGVTRTGDVAREGIRGEWVSPRPSSYDAGKPFQEWCEAWAREAFRVLKPGGYLLAFGGTRTFHRLTVGIEDAGFEIRDSLSWLYSQGFPKSLNVSRDDRVCQCQAVAYSHVAEGSGSDLSRVHEGVLPFTDETSWAASSGVLPAMQGEAGRRPSSGSGVAGPGGVDGGERRFRAPQDDWPPESVLEGRGDVPQGEGELRRSEVRAVSAGASTDGPGRWVRDGTPSRDGSVDRPDAATNGSGEPHRSEPPEQHTGEPGVVPVERGPQARRGRPVCGRCGKPVVPEGLGTALKPGWEPIVVARKPLRGTVAQNVQEFGTGALNIDATRIPSSETLSRNNGARENDVYSGGSWKSGMFGTGDTAGGRWPTNVVFTHDIGCDDEGCVSGCPVAELDTQSGNRPGMQRTVLRRGATTGRSIGGESTYGTADAQEAIAGYGDEGGASRFFPQFFYTAKAPGHERPEADGTQHPTVKPVDLMAWLIRLVLPPGGIGLDMFAGSGTTGEAAILEGRDFVLIEKDPDYVKLIRERLRPYSDPVTLARARGRGERPKRGRKKTPATADDGLF